MQQENKKKGQDGGAASRIPAGDGAVPPADATPNPGLRCAKRRAHRAPPFAPEAASSRSMFSRNCSIGRLPTSLIPLMKKDGVV